MSYPRLEAPLPVRIPIRSYLEPHPPPQSLLSNPPLPPHPAQSSDKYTVSTHVVPASYPRHTPFIPPPPAPSGNTKAERLSATKRTAEDLTQLRVDSWKGKYGGSRQEAFWNSINRYVSKRGKGRGLTLFIAHANGFPKEIWETTLGYLFDLASPIVEEVWVWESVQHGDSALLNKNVESAVFDWPDNSNDILSFLLHYLPSSSESDTLPTHLARVPESETARRKAHGFDQRTLVAMGHSYGGCTTTLSVIRCPVLFDSLILVDPVIVRKDPAADLYDTSSKTQLIFGAVQRRAEWDSRAEAHKSFAANPFFAVWDPAVLQTYVDRGLYETLDGKIQLKMSSIQEAACFLDTLTEKEVYQLLETLDKRVELFWIMPGKKEPHPIGGPGAAEVLVWRRPQNSSNVRVPNAGHLIPMHAPREFAQTVTGFLQAKYGASATPQPKL